MWGFETEIPRDQVGELPIIQPKISFFDWFRIKGDYRITLGDTPTPPEPEDDRLAVGESMILVGGYRVDLSGGSSGEEETGTYDDLGIVDGFRLSYEGG